MTFISYLTNITFEHGAVKTLGAEMDALGMKRPLIVTDRGLVAAATSPRSVTINGRFMPSASISAPSVFTAPCSKVMLVR